MPVPMGIMEKSATIMNYDLGGESIEGFGGWASYLADRRLRFLGILSWQCLNLCYAFLLTKSGVKAFCNSQDKIEASIRAIREIEGTRRQR